MSGLLVNKKKIIWLIIIIVFIMILFLNVFVAMLFAVLFLCARYIDKAAIKKLKEQVAIFSNTGRLRNVDCLIIGDMIEVPSEIMNAQSVLCLLAPNRGIEASYEILRHTHSILRDDGNGEVIIVLQEKNKEIKELSLFEVGYLHKVVIEERRIEYLKKQYRHPLFYKPICVLKFVFNIRSDSYIEKKFSHQAIDCFCNERGYKVRYFIK